MAKETYDEKISKRLAMWISKNRVRLIWGGLTVIFLHLLLYIYWLWSAGKEFANQQLSQWLPEILLLDFGGMIFAFVYLAWYKIPKELHEEEKENEKQELNLLVESDTIAQGNDAGGIILHFVLDIINGTDRKIIELDAHLSLIDQWTVDHPDDRHVSNAISTPLRKRLQWEDNSYQIDLKPGFDELKKLKIATLNCTSKKFSFLHEGEIIENPVIQQDAIYRTTIIFKGKIEGDAPDYKYFEHKTEFVCSPQHCILDASEEAIENHNLPEGLKRKLIPQTVTMPKKDELAIQMNLEIQEFRKILVSIKTLDSEEQTKLLTLARNILNRIIDERLPHANAIFIQQKQIQEKIKNLDLMFQEYCVSVNMLITKEYKGISSEFNIKKELWGTRGDKNSLESKITALIEDLIYLLNKEFRNETAE